MSKKRALGRYAAWRRYELQECVSKLRREGLALANVLSDDHSSHLPEVCGPAASARRWMGTVVARRRYPTVLVGDGSEAPYIHSHRDRVPAGDFWSLCLDLSNLGTLKAPQTPRYKTMTTRSASKK